MDSGERRWHGGKGTSQGQGRLPRKERRKGGRRGLSRLKEQNKASADYKYSG